MQKILYVLVLMGLCSCSGTGVKKVVIDESKNEPDWVSEERLSWEDDGRYFFKAQQTVRGDQRLNGCYTLASHDNRENLIRQQVESMRGQTNEAQADISENAELLLGKVRSGEWSGKIYGFKDEGYYFQRMQIRDEMAKTVTERIDCYTLSSISKADYEKSRSEIMNKILHIDQRIKDAIHEREAEFFREESKVEQPVREPEVKAEPIQAEPAKPVTKAEAPAVELPKEVKVPEVAKPVEAPAPQVETPKVPEPVADKVAEKAEKAVEKATEKKAERALASVVE